MDLSSRTTAELIDMWVADRDTKVAIVLTDRLVGIALDCQQRKENRRERLNELQMEFPWLR